MFDIVCHPIFQEKWNTTTRWSLDGRKGSTGSAPGRESPWSSLHRWVMATRPLIRWQWWRWRWKVNHQVPANSTLYFLTTLDGIVRVTKVSSSSLSAYHLNSFDRLPCHVAGTARRRLQRGCEGSARPGCHHEDQGHPLHILSLSPYIDVFPMSLKVVGRQLKNSFINPSSKSSWSSLSWSWSGQSVPARWPREDLLWQAVLRNPLWKAKCKVFGEYKKDTITCLTHIVIKIYHHR